MSWFGQNLLQILMGPLGLPVQFVGLLLTVLLVLTLAPFLGGFKVGVEIPKIPGRYRRGLIVGTLLTWVLLLTPWFPTQEPEPPCLRTAEILIADLEPQEGTLDQFLRHLQEEMELGYEIPVRLEYEAGLETRGLPQYRFTLHRPGNLAKTGCWLLAEVATGLNQALAQEGDPLRVTIFASCHRVFVAPVDSEPPSEEYLPCS